MVLQELVIDRRSGKPVSKQIAQYVRAKIYNQELLPGDKLPTTQEMMEQFGVGTHTIRQAMMSLQNEGLVKSTQGIGTLVNRFPRIQDAANDSLKSITTKLIAVVGLLQDVGDSSRFRQESAKGIISECGRLGVDVLVLHNRFSAKTPAQVYDYLVSHECRGVIYSGSIFSEETIDYLVSKGINAITHRRFRGNDGRLCIESDYDNAGYKVGAYFCKHRCEEIVIFSHFEWNCSMGKAILNGYPLSIKHGITRAFEMNGTEHTIGLHVDCEETKETSKKIVAKLRSLPKRTGLVFTNGYQLLNVLKDFGKEAHDLLSGRKIVIVSNKTVNLELKEHIGNLDVMVLVDPYEAIGRHLVGKLLGVMEGFMANNTATLIDIDFISFAELAH